jgi:hypothetical protein
MSNLQLNNAFQEFELFLEMQTKEKIMSDTTKSLIINTLLENSKGKK